MTSRTKKIRAVIADDEPLAREGLRACLAEEPDVEVVAVCSDGLEAIDAIVQEHPDLALLDVRMPGLDGFDVVDAVGAHAMPAVVFVTAYDEYAVRAFEESAVDYVLKPIVPERVARAVERVRHHLAMTGRSDDWREELESLLERLRPHRPRLRRFAVRRERDVLFVPVEDVAWIEGDRNYVKLHTTLGPGSPPHRIRATLSGLMERLGDDFIRVHRSSIVRVARIHRIEPLRQGDYVVVLDTGARVPTSRSYRAELRSLLEGIDG